MLLIGQGPLLRERPFVVDEKLATPDRRFDGEQE